MLLPKFQYSKCTLSALPLEKNTSKHKFNNKLNNSARTKQN